MCRVVLLFSFLITAKWSFAGEADLSIQLEFNEVDGVVLDRQGEFVARITNNGPDVAGIGSTLPNPISLSSGIIQDNGSFTPNIQFAPSQQNNNQNCFFLLTIGDPPPGSSVSYGYSINVPPLEVDESIECFGVFSTHFESGFREVNWRVRNSTDTDPIPENDTQRVVFGIPPRSVPVNNLYSLLALLLLTLLVGVKANRKSQII